MSPETRTPHCEVRAGVRKNPLVGFTFSGETLLILKEKRVEKSEGSSGMRWNTDLSRQSGLGSKAEERSKVGRLHGEQSVLWSFRLLPAGGSLRCAWVATWRRR